MRSPGPIGPRFDRVLRIGWLPAGLLVAAGIALWLDSAQIWAVDSSQIYAGVGLYTAGNLLGTVIVLRHDKEADNKRNWAAVFRAGFVLQLPLGWIAVALEGL